MRVLTLLRTAVRWISLALLAALVVTPLAQITMRGIFWSAAAISSNDRAATVNASVMSFHR